MFASDTAIVQDLKATIAFVRTTMRQMRAACEPAVLDSVKLLPMEAQATYALGLRHSQRHLVDALVKAFQVIAKDIDVQSLKTFDAILDAMQHATASRPAVLSADAHRHVFVARMLANTAGLIVTPAPTVAEVVYAASASLRTVEPGVAALETFLVHIEEPTA